MHGTVRPQIFAHPGVGHQRLFERACPGPLDRPHRARLYLLSFWMQNYWSRWAHARKCCADPRWNGKVSCHPDATWGATVANGLEEVLCHKLDYKLPKVFSKNPVIGFFLLWLLAYLGLGPTREDSPPEPQCKNIHQYRGGLAPFHRQRVTRPDEAEERQLVKRAKAGDVIARNKIIASHLWMTEEIAREFRLGDGDVDDLGQEAALALFKALDDFDPKSGNRFSTFAWNSVRGDMKDWLRKMRRLKRCVSTELIAEKNAAALGPYGTSVKSGVEYKIFRELFEKM
jgi:RNA polymerase sigma factor (sigma-70 family)